jgi:hypothetical protein
MVEPLFRMAPLPQYGEEGAIDGQSRMTNDVAAAFARMRGGGQKPAFWQMWLQQRFSNSTRNKQ